MARATHPPRANLREGSRAYQSGFGAYHPVPYEGEIIPFFCTLRDTLEDILPPEIDDEAETEHFRLLKKPDRMGMRVLEQRFCTEFLKRNRLRPNRNDVGRLKGQVADRIGYLGLSSDGLAITFVSADRVGCDDPDGNAEGGKFALIPDPDDPLVKRMIEAHGEVVDQVGSVYKGFEYPSRFIYRPHLTVVQVYDGATPRQVNECETSLRAMVEAHPITAEVDPLVLLPR